MSALIFLFVTISLVANGSSLPRIVGGNSASIEDRPFQVALLYQGSIRCGGAWLGGNAVLTAAQCCDGVSANEISIRVGSTQHASGGDVHSVARLLPHPRYDFFDYSNDACLLFLDQPVTNSQAKPAKLPTEELDISEGENLTVSGWGLDSEGGELLEDMKQIEIPFVSDGTCAYRYGSDNYVSKVMICAGGEGGKDPCMGDTGGPLTLGDDVHVGIVSWSYGCGRPFYPSVYAQTDALIDWIQEELRN